MRFAGAKQEGLSEAVVDKIRDDFAASDLSPRQKVVLRWTDRFLSASPDPDPELERELLVHFTPAGIVELTAAISIFMGFSKIALAIGGIPDDLPLSVQPTPDWPPG